MDFLDELLEQTAAQKASETPGSAEDKDRPTMAQQAVESRIEAFYAFLEEMVGKLSVIAPEARHSYDVPDFGKLSDLRQDNYRVVSDDLNVPKFTFSFVCRGPHRLQFAAASKNARDEKKERLDQHGLTYRIEDQSQWRYIIHLDPVVPVSFVFEPHPTRAAVTITARNLDVLGVSVYTLGIDLLTQDLMHEFGKRVLRRPNRFEHLSGHRVPEETRTQFQEKIAARMRERSEQLSTPEPDGSLSKSRAFVKGILSKARGDAQTGYDKRQEEPTELSNTELARPRSTAQAPGSGNADPIPEYGWIITGDHFVGDTATMLGKVGPPGAASRFPIRTLTNQGIRFRMRTADKKVRYTGCIAGRFVGMEPLRDYGEQHGCTTIEYERQGKWYTLRPAVNPHTLAGVNDSAGAA